LLLIGIASLLELLRHVVLGRYGQIRDDTMKDFGVIGGVSLARMMEHILVWLCGDL
jgi:hypothetical protein